MAFWPEIIQCCLLILALYSSKVETRKVPKGPQLIKNLYFQSVDTDFNRAYVGKYDINKGSSNNSLDFAITFIKDLPESFWVTLTISTRNQKIYNYNVNCCNIITRDWANKLNVVIIWIQGVLKKGNVPRECPIKKGTYSWSNLKVAGKSIPSFAMNGIYIVNVMFYIRQNANAENMVVNTTLKFMIKYE